MKLPYRILVLDYDENALSGIVEMLRDAEYHVTGATTYEEAKGLNIAGSPHLVPSTGRTNVNFRDPDGCRLQLVDSRRQAPDLEATH